MMSPAVLRVRTHIALASAWYWQPIKLAESPSQSSFTAQQGSLPLLAKSLHEADDEQTTLPKLKIILLGDSAVGKSK